MLLRTGAFISVYVGSRIVNRFMLVHVYKEHVDSCVVKNMYKEQVGSVHMLLRRGAHKLISVHVGSRMKNWFVHVLLRTDAFISVHVYIVNRFMFVYVKRTSWFTCC